MGEAGITHSNFGELGKPGKLLSTICSNLSFLAAGHPRYLRIPQPGMHRNPMLVFHNLAARDIYDELYIVAGRRRVSLPAVIKVA